MYYNHKVATSFYLPTEHARMGLPGLEQILMMLMTQECIHIMTLAEPTGKPGSVPDAVESLECCAELNLGQLLI